MNKKNRVFDFDIRTKEILDAKLILALFKILYKQESITKREYDSLVSKVYRTFNLNKDIC